MPLYVVALPIGNAADLTQRALDVLRHADRIYAEDTRRAARALSGQGVRAGIRPYHDHSDAGVREALLAEVEAGAEVALISDAGTPCISDPGYRVVAEARRRGLQVLPVPGASALTAFLSAAGLPTDRFTFFGFPPRRGGACEELLDDALTRRETAVFYESPRRLVAFVERVAARFPERQVVVARELTKTHEEWIAGEASRVHASLAARDRVLGECVVGVAGVEDERVEDAALRKWAALVAPLPLPPREAAGLLSRGLGVASSEAYDAVLRARSGRGGAQK